MSPPRTVRQVAVPPDARALSTLARVDYEDAFESGCRPDQTPEQVAKAVLTAAPEVLRTGLLTLLRTFGIAGGGQGGSDGRSDNRSIVGWEVRRSTPEFALLATGSRIGLSAELLFKPEEESLLWATFVQLDNHLSRAVWTGLAPVHRQVVPYLLRRNASRAQS